jgi:hypothetical protein
MSNDDAINHSYKTAIKTTDYGEWTTFPFRFASKKEAMAYGDYQRFDVPNISHIKTVPDPGTVTHAWVEGRLEPVAATTVDNMVSA